MHALLSLLHRPAFLGFIDLGGRETLLGFVSVVGGLAITIIVIVARFYSKHRKEQLWHETARFALEKGQPIPSRSLSGDEIKAPPPPSGTNLAEWDRLKRGQRGRKDIRNGLILTAVGLALGFSHFGGERHSFLAYVPFFVGLALLLNGLINALFPGKSGDSGDHPPQS